ncbi:unnamed protein product [Brassica rapa subsp. narinosa]
MHDSQLSITKKEDTTLLDLLRFVDSRTSFAEDSASDSHHLSSSDKGSGDRVCNVSTDAVKWETFEEDMGIKEEIRSISSKFIDLTFQPQWNHKLRAQASLLGDGEILEDMESQNESCYEGVYGREDRAGLHLEEYETNYENYYSNPFEWTTPTFHVPEYEPEEGGQARSESSSFSDHEEEPWLVDYNKTKELQVVGVVVEDGPSLHFDKCGYESTTLEETLESTPKDHLEHFQKENEKSRRTSEVVGLRHALYQTQTSPLSTLPIDTPIGSPRHILMRSHMVSPLRSLTNSSGSLSDVLSLPKKT